MPDDTAAPFLFPAAGCKKVIADFDGGRLICDGGAMLLAAAERRLRIAERLAGLIADPRNPLFVTHSVAGILHARATPTHLSPPLFGRAAAGGRTAGPAATVLAAAAPALAAAASGADGAALVEVRVHDRESGTA